ncbi:MAG: membrane protein insertase YidC [Candidatus Eisenbacteria bacterium]|nr:membrane protein insertase YidC [Candidatus Eisenbacteria bacterium]
MDRRMLLAMALAILVLAANSLIFGKRGPRPGAPREGRDTSAVRTSPAPPIQPQRPPAVATPAGLSSGGSQLGNPGAMADTTGIVVVETDVLRAEFDPVGGAIRSWRLKRYTDAREEPADLVRTRSTGALWFAIRDGERIIRTDSTRFSTEVAYGPTETVVTFSAQEPGGIGLVRTFRLEPGRYDARMDIRVSGAGERAEGGEWEIGWVDGLPAVERDPRGDHLASSAVALFGKEFMKKGASGGMFGCAGGGQGSRTEVHEGTLRWAGVRNKYFLGALLLDQPRDRRVVTSHNGAAHSAGALISEPLSMSGVTETSYKLYLGPIHYTSLSSYGLDLERVQDLGPGVLRPFSKLLMKFFVVLNSVISNYGFVILILSVLIRVIFYPLTKKSMNSMKRMQALKPEMDRISQKYKNDPEKKNREVMELYRKNKINPLGGCLPVLVQLPVLSGLYYVLANAVQLRKEPFLLWMRDLSAPDTVAHVAGFPLNVLPLIMAGTMVWQQKITPSDPRQASLGYIMPIFMTFLFYSTPSGLVFYWTVSNLLTVLQQIWMNRSSAGAAAMGAGDMGLPGGGGTGR